MAQMCGWSVVIPVKGGVGAKSRLRAELGAPLHRRLAWAMALDCVAAVLAAAPVSAVVIVSGDAGLADDLRDLVPVGPRVTVLVQAGTGLNPAVAQGFQACRPGPVAALLADLPALRAATMAEALEVASTHLDPGCFVPDAPGTGTVLVAGVRTASRPGPATQWAAPEPRGNRQHAPWPRTWFGPDSADRHRHAGLTMVPGKFPGLRQDVDTAADLAEAVALGVGTHTSQVLAGVWSDPGHVHRRGEAGFDPQIGGGR